MPNVATTERLPVPNAFLPDWVVDACQLLVTSKLLIAHPAPHGSHAAEAEAFRVAGHQAVPPCDIDLWTPTCQVQRADWQLSHVALGVHPPPQDAGSSVPAPASAAARGRPVTRMRVVLEVAPGWIPVRAVAAGCGAPPLRPVVLATEAIGVGPCLNPIGARLRHSRAEIAINAVVTVHLKHDGYARQRGIRHEAPPQHTWRGPAVVRRRHGRLLGPALERRGVPLQGGVHPCAAVAALDASHRDVARIGDVAVEAVEKSRTPELPSQGGICNVAEAPHGGQLVAIERVGIARLLRAVRRILASQKSWLPSIRCAPYRRDSAVRMQTCIKSALRANHKRVEDHLVL
mmetsp:Transcript_36999/g.97445  ORF Transcript_36999/g.97445 Transcript_36999/m.97445 type:complete len:346 (-) Transcript_36999:6757-7794(-)